MRPAPETLARSGLLVGSAAAASRVLGFLRDLLVASVLGAGPAADALFVALRLPNLARRILSEGALNGAILPVEGRIRAEQGDDAADRFAGSLLAVTGAVGVAKIVFWILLAPVLVYALAAGFAGDPQRFPDAVFYTRLALPLGWFAAMAAMAGSFLAARGRFAVAAWAPVAVNLVVVGALLVIPRLALPAESAAGAIAAALLAGGAVQLLCVGAALWAGPDRPRFALPWWTPAIWRVFTLALPGLLVAASAQLSMLAAVQLASLHDGTVAHLSYADRLYQLPLGFVAAGAGVVLAAGLVRDRTSGLVLVEKALGQALLLAVPAAAALALLAERIVAALFERGAFGPADTQATAALLAALALALPASAASRVLAQPFLVSETPRVPVLGALLALAATLGGGLVLGRSLGPSGIAWGVTLGAWAEAAWLAAALGMTGWRPRSDLPRRLAGVAAATAVMAAALLAVGRAWPDTGVSSARVVALAVLCLGGLAVYGLAAWLTGALRAADFRSRS